MTYIIYLSTNVINGKQYVGQTQTDRLDRRVWEHLFDATHLSDNNAFHNAIVKYGIENFTFEIIEQDIPEDLIDQREQYWISFYNTYIHSENSNGYNSTIGGQGTHGYVFTEADRSKMSQKQKSYWKKLKEENPEEYARLCEIRRLNKLGKKWDEASRQKLSESCKGRTPWNKNLKGAQIGWNRGTSTLPLIEMRDLETNKIIQTFINVYEAARIMFPEKDTKTVATRIYTVCKQAKGKAYGYFWRFSESDSK